MIERTWITDGSVPVFSDTRRLRASHRGLFGLPVRYEGFIDPAVPHGRADVKGDRPDDVLFVESEWHVELVEGIDHYLAEPDAIDDSTPIVLRGLIEGKWMNRLLETREWLPASLGNNVVAGGPGILTTVGAIEAGQVEGLTRVEYALAGGGSQAYTTTLGDLRGQNVLHLLRDIVRACRDDGDRVDGIDLGAFGESAATVNESRRLRAAIGVNPFNLAPHRAKERLVRGALADDISVPPETPVNLTTVDGRGAIVGVATLTWALGPVRPSPGSDQLLVELADSRAENR